MRPKVPCRQPVNYGLSSRGPGFKSLTEHFSKEQRDEERAERRGFELASNVLPVKFESLTEQFPAELSSKSGDCVSRPRPTRSPRTDPI